jgi:hypothetical protein
MRVVVGHMMNLETVDHKFILLVDYIKYKLLEGDNKKLKQQWVHEHTKKMAKYVEEQMQEFDKLHAVKLKERKWGWHPLYHMFTSIHVFQCLAPLFPWVHSQEEATSLCDSL